MSVSFLPNNQIQRESTYRWDLIGQINLLGQGHGTLLQRALEIDILDLLTQIDLLLQQGNQAPFNLQEHRSALLDGIAQGTFCFDGEGLATRIM